MEGAEAVTRPLGLYLLLAGALGGAALAVVTGLALLWAALSSIGGVLWDALT